jgi:hypothetical protein
MAIEPPETVERTKPNHHWFDLTISICALITSALSMYVAYNNDESLERLVHANSWPFLQMDDGNGDDQGNSVLYFSVTNEGTGPARVHSLSISYDGQPLPMNRDFGTALFQHAGIDTHGHTVITRSNSVSRRFLGPRQNVIAWAWSRTADNAAIWYALDEARQQGHITMQACYCSVFDECWIAQTNRFPPQPTRACRTDPPQN